MTKTKKLVHAGFLINIPAKGGRGAREVFRHQPIWWGKFIPSWIAEYVFAISTDSLCYFGPSPIVSCDDGTEVVVHILGIPATSGTLLDPKRPLHRKMMKRLLVGPERILELSGEEIAVLGLGAATAIAGGHGREIFKTNRSLKNPIPIITNGNTITAELAIDIAFLAAERWLSRNPEVIGVVGGFGSVGSRVMDLVACRFKPNRIYIVTREEKPANGQVLQSLRERYPNTDFKIGRLQDALSCPVVFLAASSVEPLPIDPNWLPKNSVIIDIGKPLNTSPELAAVCRDKGTLIVDGSLAKLPDGTDWKLFCDRMVLPKNAVFGCLAETITIACLLARGELDEYVYKSTFIGRPDDKMAKTMVTEAKQIGLEPYFWPLHKV